MTEQESIYDQILHEPEERTHKLVYADWLEEHTEDRTAELAYTTLCKGLAKHVHSEVFR